MKMKTTLKAALALCLASATAFADVITVPGAGEGNSSDNAPLGASEQHFQQILAPSLLGSFAVGDYINGLAFRVNGGETALPAQTIGNYEISLSVAARNPNTMSTTFSVNRGADFMMVRSGPLTITPGQFPGGPSANAFGWIPFTTSYQYLGGPLLIEIAFQGFTFGRNADAIYPFNGNNGRTGFGSGYSSTTADLGLYNEALVIGFDRSLVPIPEPSTTMMVTVGFLLLFCNTCRRMRS